MTLKNLLRLKIFPGSKIWFLCLIPLILSVILLYTSFWWGPIINDYSHRRAFDSKIWKDSLNGDYYNEVRLWMVNDLLKKYNLLEMSKAVIEDLIGVPPKTSYFKKYDYIYRLGNERGLMSVDSEWLVIKFKDDRVTEACLTRD